VSSAQLPLEILRLSNVGPVLHQKVVEHEVVDDRHRTRGVEIRDDPPVVGIVAEVGDNDFVVSWTASRWHQRHREAIGHRRRRVDAGRDHRSDGTQPPEFGEQFHRVVAHPGTDRGKRRTPHHRRVHRPRVAVDDPRTQAASRHGSLRYRRIGAVRLLRFLGVLLYASYLTQMGMLLTILPWSDSWPALILKTPPVAASWLSEPSVRGVLTAFGVLHFGVLLWEALGVERSSTGARASD
jgi:hypothetical protein